MEKKTPFEVFIGKKPGVKHLRMCGCICYTHILSVLRQKLDGKSEKGVFMGYGSCEKGYRVYVLQTKKIVLSRNVIFDEEKSWDWKENKVEFVSTYFPFKDNEGKEENNTGQSHFDSGESSYSVSSDTEVTENGNENRSQYTKSGSTLVKLKSLEDI